MRVVTIRKTTDASLVAFGPEDGMYDPGYDPLTTRKALELDYTQVLAEWTALQAVTPAPVNKRAAALANPSVPQWFKDYIA